MKLDKVLAVRTSKIIYRHIDKAVKVFDEDYLKSDILNEALNNAKMEETNLNIPKLKEVCMIDNKWAIINEFIEGKSLDRLMKENPELKDDYIERFVDLQLGMYREKAPLLNRLKDKMIEKISFTDLEATLRYSLYAQIENMPNDFKICHGDFNPSNIIMTNDNTPYIIDWSHATRGNSESDIAWTYLCFQIDDEKEIAQHYMDLIIQKSGLDKKEIIAWIPMVAAAHLPKSSARTKEKLLKWINNPV